MFGGAGYGTNPQQGGFGSGALGQPQAGGGLFGGGGGAGGFGAPAASGMGGFGGGTGGAFGAPAATGGFGGNTFGSPGAFGRPAQTGGGFGAPFGSSGGGFGGTSGLGTSAFGTPNPTFGGGGSAFGASGAGGGMFGGIGSASKPGGMFGSPQATTQGVGGAFGGTPGFGGGQMTQGFGVGGGGAFGNQMGASQQEMHNPGNEMEIKREERPNDTITSVNFMPSADPNAQYLAVSSWDQTVRVYQHSMTANAVQGKGMVTAQSPVLNTCFRPDGTVLAACADGTVQLWNVASGSNQMQTFGKHEMACQAVSWIPELGMAVTAGWDKRLMYWDMRQQNPAQVINLEGKVHAMAVRGSWLVAACSGPAFPVYVFNLANPQQPFRVKMTQPGQAPQLHHPKLSIRTIAISNDCSFYCLAGVEGRVLVHYFDETKAKTMNFSFKAHRTDDNNSRKPLTFSNCINDIKFCPEPPKMNPQNIESTVLATCGSDGAYYYWSISARSRLSMGPPASSNSLSQSQTKGRCMFPGGQRPAPIVASDFNAEGSVYAYAVGYDWNAGPQWNVPSQQVNAVVLHYVKPSELKKKSN